MELVLNSSKLEVVPQQEDDLSKPLGFLNSQYKTVVNDSLKDTSKKSIFGLRRRIKSSRYYLTSGVEVALKVSTFFAIILVIFS